MATGRARAKKSKMNEAAASLVDALKFVAPTQKKSGGIQETHVVMFNNMLIGSNGILTIGYPIEEDLNACPNSELLLAALNKCGETFSITKSDETSIVINSDQFQATIPCVDINEMSLSHPDQNIAEIGNTIKDGFKQIMFLATKGSKHVLTASIMLRPNSMVATNNIVILEYWHGYDLPPNILVPKECATSVAKCKRDLTGFGFSGATATFWFDDKSFVKCKLFEEEYPNIDAILNKTLNPFPPVDDFFKAIKAVDAASRTGKVIFTETGVQSHNEINEGSKYEIEGLPVGKVYDSKNLIKCEPFCDRIDFTSYNGQAFFFGENIRGAIVEER